MKKKGDIDIEIIPSYDHVFTEQVRKDGKKKSGFLKFFFKKNFSAVLFNVLIYLVQSLPVYVMPIATANIIDLSTAAIRDGLNDYIIKMIIINLALFIGTLLLNIPATMLRYKVLHKVLRKNSAGIKSAVVRKLQSLSITYHKEIETGKIQAKFLKDTDKIDEFFFLLMNNLLLVLVSTVVFLTISICKNWMMALLFVVVVPLNVSIARIFRGKIRSGFKDLRVKNEDMSSKMNTMLEMIPVTKAHGLEETEIKNINAKIKNVANSGYKVDMTTAKFGALIYVCNNSLNFLCLGFCIFLAIKGKISVGDIVLYQTMLTQINNYVNSMVMFAPAISSGLEAVSSVSEIMNSDDIEVSLGKKNIRKVEGNIEFKNVTYRYPHTEEDVIKNFSLSVKKGECIAFVGPSGGGKTTLTNLITGLLLPTSGDVLIDGESTKDINLSDYRHNIAVVPQTSILFYGSIKDNVTYGLETFDEEKLNEVIKEANLTELIDSLPDGLNTIIGEHGEKLSGGQKQRITIARALMRDPKILILDEATSALDSVSEYLVQQAVYASVKGRTSFVVAHRLSTIRNADRIVVVGGGKIVETGTYQELLDKKGEFYKLKTLNDLTNQKAEEDLN